MAEWLRNGLQIRLPRFDSGRGLQHTAIALAHARAGLPGGERTTGARAVMEQDFTAKRTRMVDCQIRTTNVMDWAVLSAFGEVPREAFVPASLRDMAYLDEDLRVSGAKSENPRYLMEPSPLAKLLQLAEIGENDLVLDIGCATGYSSAIISRIAGSVIAIESDDDLAARATETLADLGYDNVAVVSCPLEDGLESEAPYDVIVLGGSVERVPDKLLDQLRDGGRLVAVIGDGNAAQARLFVKHDGIISSRMAFNAAIRPLPGFRNEPVFEF